MRPPNPGQPDFNSSTRDVRRYLASAGRDYTGSSVVSDPASLPSTLHRSWPWFLTLTSPPSTICQKGQLVLSSLDCASTQEQTTGLVFRTPNRCLADDAVLCASVRMSICPSDNSQPPFILEQAAAKTRFACKQEAVQYRSCRDGRTWIAGQRILHGFTTTPLHQLAVCTTTAVKLTIGYPVLSFPKSAFQFLLPQASRIFSRILVSDTEPQPSHRPRPGLARQDYVSPAL